MSARERVEKWAAPGLAALGLADSAYLAVIHWRGEVPACGGYSGCAAVSSSAYAEVFGVPVAAFGAAMYVVVLGLALLRVQAVGRRQGQATVALYSLALSGAIFVTYLTAIELFVLHDVCYWCLGLAAITFGVLALSARDVLRLGAEGQLRPLPARVAPRPRPGR